MKLEANFTSSTLKFIIMKKLTVTALIFASALIFSNEVSAQAATSKEVKKEVNVEENNGEKVVTIKTTENGKTTTEVFKGEEADAKLAEMKNEKSGTKKTIKMDENGKKALLVEKKVVKVKGEKQD
jgi:hypothetical protein